MSVDPEISAVSALLAILEGEGVEYIFGVQGGPLTALFEALRERDRIRFILAKHEEGAAFMAATYARVRGTLAVCCATSGPGATNALTGIASAQAEALPVLFLSGQVSTRVFGKGAIQESSVHGTDLVQIFKPVTKLSTMVTSGAQLPQIAQEAVRQALSVRRGPVHLNLPADILTHRIRPVVSAPVGVGLGGSPVDVAAAGVAAQRLAAAHKPCILAGYGIAQSGAHAELLELAERLSIPVATTPKGKDAFPETHRLSLGVVGFGGHPRADAFFGGGVEVLLVVGSSLGEFATNSWDPRIKPRGSLIHVDHDPSVLGRNYAVDVGVVGDARAVLRRIIERLPASTRAHGDPLQGLRREVARYEGAALMDSDDVPLKPPRLMRELRAALPDDGMLFVDNGNSILWGGHYFEARQPGTYFIDLGLASMGSAVAGAIGGKLASPGRAAVALVGDAAFAMNGMEVHTAVEHEIPVVWVVLNNQGHNMVMQGEKLLRGADLGYAQFKHRLDIVGLARALGANACRVDSGGAFRGALEEALASRRPWVIDAIVDATVAPPTLERRARSLARFFGAR